MADEAQTNNESDPGVAEHTQEETAVEQQQTSASHEQRNQWILFGILAAILLGVVLVIALIRPLIFDRIVPAVMGDFNTPVPTAVEEASPTESAPTAEDAFPVEENSEAGASESEDNQVFIPAAASGDGTGEAGSEENPAAEQAVEEPVAAPTPEPVTHTVQVGDNLTKISQQYGVSVEAIMAANNLTNADLISVGQVLLIPTN